MILSTILISAVQAGTLQGGLVVSAQESVMYGGEVRVDPPSPVSFYARGLLGEASSDDLAMLRRMVEGGSGQEADLSGVNWQRLRIEMGTMWTVWDATALGNGAFLNVGAEAVRGSFPGRDEHFDNFSVIADIDSSYWVQPVIELGAALNVPFLARFEIKQSVGYSLPVWSTGYVFNERDGLHLTEVNEQFNAEFGRASFTSPYFETVTTMTGEAGLSWFSIRTRIRSYSASEWVDVVKAYTGDEVAKNYVEIMPEFVFGVGF